MKKDLEFLKNIRLPERPGGIASLDKEYCKKKIQKKKTLSKKADSQTVGQNYIIFENFSTDDEINSDDKIWKILSKKRKKQAEPKSNALVVIKQTLTRSNLVADKSGVSIRAQFKYTAQLLSSAGMIKFC